MNNNVDAHRFLDSSRVHGYLVPTSTIKEHRYMTPVNGLKPKTRDRAEIPEIYTWNLSQIYPDWSGWEAALAQLQGLMDSYQKLKDTLAEGPQRILEASRLSDELGQLAYRVYQYPGLMQSQDTRDNAVQARLEQVQLALAAFRQATAWYTPELLEIPEGTMRGWLDETPELAPYRFGIEESYRMQRHVLDEDGERLLAYAATFNGTPAHTYSMLADADVEFPTVTFGDGTEMVASHANYSLGLYSLRAQSDREKLFNAHFTVYDEYPNTYAAIYNGVLQKDWFTARSRHYDSTLEAKLDDDNIPMAVVENLIDPPRRGSGPLQRYQRLRKSTLGLERYRYFDAYLPLVEIEWLLPYDTVGRLVVDSVEVFGADYQKTVERAFSDRWIDVYENEGKRSGAFSAGVYGVHPYMLLNYADTLNDAFTLAHEMGHTMHTVLSHETQPFATSSYSIFVAEVASMTNESLFLDRLLAGETDPGRRITLLQHAIDDISAGFYRQAMFAEFELEAHRAVESGHPITAEVLQEIYLGVLDGFFAGTLDDQPWYCNTWARISHFYGAPYYVFQYATSKAAASLLHRRMTNGDQASRTATVEAYLDLLRSGGNDHPVTLLKKAGVDLATTEPTEALVAEMDSLVDRLENELLNLNR